MLLAHHPDIRISRRTLGVEGAPLLVIDNLVSDPDRLVRKASNSQFVKHSSMFPGIRAAAPLSYQQFLEKTLNPLLRECFDLAPGRFLFPMCHFSLVTQPPGELAFPQRVPHIDSVRRDGLACITCSAGSGVARGSIGIVKVGSSTSMKHAMRRTSIAWRKRAAAKMPRRADTSMETARCSSVSTMCRASSIE